MLFRRRKDGAGSDPADERATSIADGEDHEAHAPAAGGDDDEPPIPADRAVDFIAEMLRLLGEHAFDVGPKTAEEIEATFEAWARHLLLGIAPPGRETEDAGRASGAMDRSRGGQGMRRERARPNAAASATCRACAARSGRIGTRSATTSRRPSAPSAQRPGPS